MRRWLFNLATAVSLVLCVATVAIWMRSRQHFDLWVLPLPGRYSNLESSNGSLHFSYVTREVRVTGFGASLRSRETPSGFMLVRNALMTRVQSAHFRLDSPQKLSGTLAGGWVVGVPHWFIATSSSVMPLIWLIARWYARRQKRLGLCPTCGYDLRATPDRCPECGAVPGGSDQRSGLSDQKSQTVPPSS